MAASASPTAMSHPIPLRSADSPTIGLAHPTPDLGTYTSSIERLEDQAERMSSRGSDIGEEIRKLQLEQKLSDSRRSSLHSGPLEEAARPFSTRSRNASTSSYANSVIDVNGAARWGGYSPGGFVTSPVGSLRSAASFNQSQLSRQRSGSRASRLGQVVHTEDAHDESPEQGGSPDSPRSRTSAAAPGQQRDASPPPQSQRSVSSFTRRHDQMIQEIQDELHHTIDPDDGPSNMRQEHYADERDPRYHDYPDRPPTAASTDTTHQARTLWHDFDGVHCPDTVIEEEPTPSHRSGSGSRHSSLLRTVGDLPPQGAPPPADNMVFYPAPVPKMLNLPKRLSQVPAANVQAKRRTQLLESMNVENRKSAAWLPDDMGATSSKPNRKSMDPRMSRMSLAGLPPQLRASAYFDQVGPAQEFEIKGESAEDTLDSILEASAHAPVSAFTDHPFAGHSGADIYAPEHARKPSKAPVQDKVESRKSRGSLNLLDTRRNSSGDPLNKLKKRNSSHDLNMLTVRASTSRMSLGDELDDPDREDRGPDAADDLTPTARSIDGENVVHPDDELEGEEEEEEEAEEEPQYFGPPTTLLAELQMRKQQQKSRNLTAATAFPNGMHATLLELDAVAEIERKKRKGQKVNLAWEAPPQHGDDEDDSDDDVPLGLLFPGRDGLVNNNNNRAGAQQRDLDWDRPLGLIAQRELEDNEPLSRRRNRLLGVDPNRPLAKRNTQAPGITLSQQHLAVPSTGTPQPESDGEDEVETLAQRLRRLKNRQALDNALDPGVRKSTVSGDFAAEMMSQLGLPEEEEAKQKSATGEEVEETLGQRRERLRAEAAARGDASPMGARPPLRASLSMADILAANPLTNSNSARKVSDEQLLSSLPQGSLLLQNEQKQSQRRADRINANSRISSYGNLDKPLLGDVGKGAPEQPIDAKIQAYKEKMYGAATPQAAPVSAPSMMFTPNMNGSTLRTVPSMNFPGQRDSYLPQANMGMNSQLGMNPMNPMMPGMNRMSSVPNGFGMPGPNMMPQQMMGMNMGMNNGMGMPMGMPIGMPMGGMPGMTYPYPQMNPMGGMHQPGMGSMPMPMNGMSMQDMAEMDQRQRDMVDRWRQTIVP